MQDENDNIAGAQDREGQNSGVPSRERRWLNVLSIACAGAALICDGYHNSLMSAVNLIFKQEYPKEYDSTYSTRVSNAMTVGQIIGMITMGLLCDLVNRKRAIVFTTLCMVVGSILATAAHGVTTHGMFWMIVVMRGFIGFGVGGEFPVSSTITLEAANENEKTSRGRNHRRGWLFILVVNVPLQMGGPLCMSILLIVWEAAGGLKHLSTIWRVMFGIGCVWPLLVFALRMKLITSQLFKEGKFINYAIPWGLAVRFYWKRLIGTCGSFFLYDFIVFPNGIFSSLILKSIVKGGDTKKTAEWNLLLGALTLPGVFAGALLCNVLGRKRTMLLGFFGFVVFGLVVGCAFKQLSKIVPLFVVFYGLFQAVGHMGPGTMMGLITTEAYATGVRGTFYGLSSAFGRAGGAVGTQAFNPIKDHLGQRWTFIISAIIGGFAMLWVWLFMPDLDGGDLVTEDERFERYLRAHGYDGTIGYVERVSSPGSDGLESEAGSEKMKPDEEVAVSVEQTAFERDVAKRSFWQDVFSTNSQTAFKHGGEKRTFWQRVFSMDPLDI